VSPLAPRIEKPGECEAEHVLRFAVDSSFLGVKMIFIAQSQSFDLNLATNIDTSCMNF